MREFGGAYTTARTVDRSAVFELQMHCTRLHDTAIAVLERTSKENEEENCMRRVAREFLQKAGPEGLKPLLRSELLAGLGYLQSLEEPSGNPTDYQVTVLLTCDGTGDHTPPNRGFDVFTYVQPLPTMAATVAVEAHEATRRNPTIKDVQWVSDRAQLEEIQKAAGVNEIVMFDATGQITEGLQTNFFALTKDGSLLTAPDEQVLSGTVRKVVLDVAKENGIEVRLKCPNINDLFDWESCFVCSTSRLVKPIHDLFAPALSKRKSFPSSGSGAHRLEALVRESVRSHAEPL